jgi:serine/threonine-protein kinase
VGAPAASAGAAPLRAEEPALDGRGRGQAQARAGRTKAADLRTAAAVERAQKIPAPAAPAPPPVAEAQAEPQGTGTVTINAQPWARVKVNGRAMGETPVGPVRVPAGTVRIVFEREGRTPLSRTITLAPGEDRSVSVPFP